MQGLRQAALLWCGLCPHGTSVRSLPTIYRASSHDHPLLTHPTHPCACGAPLAWPLAVGWLSAGFGPAPVPLAPAPQLGGLILRYFIKLVNESPLAPRIVFQHFMTLSSPHLVMTDLSQ